jgi:hypothetical protein
VGAFCRCGYLLPCLERGLAVVGVVFLATEVVGCFAFPLIDLETDLLGKEVDGPGVGVRANFGFFTLGAPLAMLSCPFFQSIDCWAP